jgi:hypothetical protein
MWSTVYQASHLRDQKRGYDCWRPYDAVNGIIRPTRHDLSELAELPATFTSATGDGAAIDAVLRADGA